MMWFDPSDQRCLFGDRRNETLIVTDRTHREDGTRAVAAACILAPLQAGAETVATMKNAAGNNVVLTDVEHEFHQALSLVQRLGVSHGYQTDYATSFSEFQTWLQEQIKTNDP